VHALYVVVQGSKPHLDHVLFPTFCVSGPDLAARYESVKRANATACLPIGSATATPKANLITELLALARSDAGPAC